jgi:hypothetical protein
MDETLVVTTLITTIGTTIVGPIVAYLLKTSPSQKTEKSTSQQAKALHSPPPSKQKLEKWKKLSIIGLIVIVIVNVGVLGFVLNGYFAPVNVDITYPSQNSNVGIAEVVQGTSQNIPGGKSLWILVYIPTLDRYYPMLNPPLLQSNGDWSCLTTIGGPTDSGTFQIVAMLTDKNAQNAFDTYNKNSAPTGNYPGILTQELPSGLIEYQRVNVTRTPLVESTVSVEINSPTNGSTQSYSATVTGTSKNVPNSDKIWLVVYIPKVNRYYPMPGPAAMDSTGNWYSFATLGGENDIGDQFDIIAVVANATAEDGIVNYNLNSMKVNNFEGITSLPTGAVEYSRVQVIRG